VNAPHQSSGSPQGRCCSAIGAIHSSKPVIRRVRLSVNTIDAGSHRQRQRGLLLQRDNCGIGHLLWLHTTNDERETGTVIDLRWRWSPPSSSFVDHSRPVIILPLSCIRSLIILTFTTSQSTHSASNSIIVNFVSLVVLYYKIRYIY